MTFDPDSMHMINVAWKLMALLFMTHAETTNISHALFALEVRTKVSFVVMFGVRTL